MAELPHLIDPKLLQLATLGDQGDYLNWPQYIELYQFDVSDIPALISVVGDERYDVLEQDDRAAWTTMHAWRVLGQLKAVQALDILVANIERFSDDDVAISELSKVFSLIGESSFEPLAKYFRQKEHSEFAYVIAMDALFELVAIQPDLREQVFTEIAYYLREPIMQFYSLNGLIVGHLLDFEAIELIEEIRYVYSLNCVDLSCVGDVEDVEIYFGLKEHRENPKAVMKDVDESIHFDDEVDDGQSESDEILEFLNHVLLEYGGDDSIIDISELDGFFAAVLCAPEMIMPSAWFPLIWDSGDYMPEWPHKQEYEKISHVIFSIYNSIASELNEACYEPVFLEYFDGNGIHIVANSWADGFVRGLSLWDMLSPEDEKVLNVCMEPISQFVSSDLVEDTEALSYEKSEAIRDEIAPAVARLHSHFFQFRKRPNATFVHAQPKVGRNDPCPCGSGIKYKKCCGLN